MTADAAGCGGSALPLQPTNALASSSTAAPKNSRATRARPFWVIDGFMNSLLKAELDADTCRVDVAVAKRPHEDRGAVLRLENPRVHRSPGDLDGTCIPCRTRQVRPTVLTSSPLPALISGLASRV